MDADRLRYFCTISRTGNLRRAAELLGLSPAALSKGVKALESELGVRLVAPSGRGIVLTDAGKRLAARAERLVAELEALPAYARGPSTPTRELRLGSFEVFTTHALPELLEACGEVGRLVLHELVPGKLEKAVRDGEVDLGITYLPIPDPDLDFLPAATVTMGVFTRTARRLEEPLDGLPFVVPASPLEGTPTKMVGLDGWPDNEAPRRILYRVTLMESALELCRQGLAAAFLPRFVIALHNRKAAPESRLEEHPAAPPIAARYLKQPVYLIKRKGDEEGALAKRLAKGLRRLCSL